MGQVLEHGQGSDSQSSHHPTHASVRSSVGEGRFNTPTSDTSRPVVRFSSRRADDSSALSGAWADPTSNQDASTSANNELPTTTVNAPQAAETVFALPGRPEQTDVNDPVVRFLQEVGLSPSLADAMRQVGISDDQRMRALGALPRAALARVEKDLRAAGFDTVARVLIREGLKRRAQAR